MMRKSQETKERKFFDREEEVGRTMIEFFLLGSMINDESSPYRDP